MRYKTVSSINYAYYCGFQSKKLSLLILNIVNEFKLFNGQLNKILLISITHAYKIYWMMQSRKLKHYFRVKERLYACFLIMKNS